MKKPIAIAVCIFCASIHAAPQLAQQAELACNGEIKLKVLAGAHGLPPPTPQAHFYTLTRGTETKKVKWFAAEDIWREKAFAGRWRDKRGNEMALAKVKSLVPEFENGMAEKEEIEAAIARLEENFEPNEAALEKWKHIWGGGDVGRFVTVKNAGVFYLEFVFKDNVADKDAQKLLKAAAASISAKTAGVSAANTSMKWWTSENDQYVFLTNLDRAKGGKFITDAMKLMSAMRQAYEFHVPPTKPIGKCKVRVFKTLADYKEYLKDCDSAGLEFSCGMWVPSREELLISAEDPKQAQNTMRHEAFHQYLFYATGRGDHALWFNEGFATFFENVKYNPATKSVKVVDEGNRAKWVAKDPDAVARHMRDLPGMSRSSYYSGDVNLNYVTGWALMYFLEKGSYASEDFALYRKVVPDYLEAIKSGASAQEATEKAWAPLASRNISVDFLEFWSRLRSAARKKR